MIDADNEPDPRAASAVIRLTESELERFIAAHPGLCGSSVEFSPPEHVEFRCYRVPGPLRWQFVVERSGETRLTKSFRARLEMFGEGER